MKTSLIFLSALQLPLIIMKGDFMKSIFRFFVIFCIEFPFYFVRGFLKSFKSDFKYSVRKFKQGKRLVPNGNFQNLISKLQKGKRLVPNENFGKLAMSGYMIRGKIRQYGYSLNGEYIMGLKGVGKGYTLIHISDFRKNPEKYLSFQNLWYNGKSLKFDGLKVVSNFLKSNPIKPIEPIEPIEPNFTFFEKSVLFSLSVLMNILLFSLPYLIFSIY